MIDDPVVASDLGAQWPYALATLLFAAGMWLLLPRGRRGGRRLGAGLAAAGLALLVLLVHFGLTIHDRPPRSVEFTVPFPALGSWAHDGVFLILAVLTVGSAICSVTFRSPVYCAIWFAMTLLGTAGLFFYQGSQFLGVATIVVYAGAILVTFLFVLMLAQPEGHAFYDRVSWEGPLAACAGAVMVGLLTMTFAAAFAPNTEQQGSPPRYGWLEPAIAAEAPAARNENILATEHVASLGRTLFSTHLIAVEVAGTLLLVALVGAIAIIAHSQKTDASSITNEPAALRPRSTGGAHG
ncbi:MAG TPA: NADH-quinone oxidoreductase subunit J [Pirellulales bacterium]|nr:NADH-quinone oxidoreductase subunit J [Pirellulales bacterium]